MVFLRSPWSEVLLYVFGMLCLGAGFGFSVISLDPSPLPSFTWWYFLIAGIALVIMGVSVLGVVVIMPIYPKTFTISRQSANETTCSAADLLNDSQCLSFTDSPVIQLRNTAFVMDEDTHVVQQCMMTKTSISSNSSVFFYKETFV